MRLWLALALIIGLAACTGRERAANAPTADAGLAEAVIVAEPAVEGAPDKAAVARCLPGPDDGIGGTGCPVE
jgi:hypothetical protein